MLSQTHSSKKTTPIVVTKETIYNTIVAEMTMSYPLFYGYNIDYSKIAAEMKIAFGAYLRNHYPKYANLLDNSLVKRCQREIFSKLKKYKPQFRKSIEQYEKFISEFMENNEKGLKETDESVLMQKLEEYETKNRTKISIGLGSLKDIELGTGIAILPNFEGLYLQRKVSILSSKHSTGLSDNLKKLFKILFEVSAKQGNNMISSITAGFKCHMGENSYYPQTPSIELFKSDKVPVVSKELKCFAEDMRFLSSVYLGNSKLPSIITYPVYKNFFTFDNKKKEYVIKVDDDIDMFDVPVKVPDPVQHINEEKSTQDPQRIPLNVNVMNDELKQLENKVTPSEVRKKRDSDFRKQLIETKCVPFQTKIFKEGYCVLFDSSIISGLKKTFPMDKYVSKAKVSGFPKCVVLCSYDNFMGALDKQSNKKFIEKTVQTCKEIYTYQNLVVMIKEWKENKKAALVLNYKFSDSENDIIKEYFKMTGIKRKREEDDENSTNKRSKQE